MPTYPNAGYNSPALGQALGNIASLFAPPSPQDTLIAQTLQQQRDAAAAQQATAAARADAFKQKTPYQQQLLNEAGGDPVLAAKFAQLDAATSGAPLSAQDPYAYAAYGQAGNTIGGRQANMQIPSGNKVVVPAGVLGKDPVTIENEAADPTPTTDSVAAAAIKTLPTDQQIAWALKRGQGGGTNVNIDNKAQTAEEAGYGGAIGGVLKDVVDRAAAAPQTLAQVATLRDAVNRAGPNLTTGPFAQGVLKAKQAWGSLTGTTLDGVPEAEVVNNIGQTLAAAGARTITNRPTQFEFAQQLQTKPGLAQSPQGMMTLLNLKEQGARDDQALGQLAADPNNRKNWLAVQQAYFDAHPVMSPFHPGQPLSQADIDAIPSVGADAANGGAGGPAVQPGAPSAAAPPPRSPFGAPPSPMAAGRPGPSLSPFNVNGPVASASMSGAAAPAAAQPDASGVVAVSDPVAARRLPPGTKVRLPDGTIGTVPGGAQ